MDEKCEVTAKTLLEESPHLQECHTVILGGRRFTTRVGGLDLVDILEKYCAVSDISEYFDTIYQTFENILKFFIELHLISAVKFYMIKNSLII